MHWPHSSYSLTRNAIDGKDAHITCGLRISLSSLKLRGVFLTTYMCLGVGIQRDSSADELENGARKNGGSFGRKEKHTWGGMGEEASRGCIAAAGTNALF